MKKIDLPIMNRSASVVKDSADKENRTIEVVWSTGSVVRRSNFFTGERYDEELSLEPEHVNLARLNQGAPLLDTHQGHQLSNVIGVVERAWLAKTENGFEGRAKVRFSERADVLPLWQDVEQGIIRNISVGYVVRKFEVTEKADEPPLFRAIDWEPLELSAVPVGADAGAGFREKDKLNSCELIMRKEDYMSEETILEETIEPEVLPETKEDLKPEPSSLETEERAVKAERHRIENIYDAQEKLGLERGIAVKFVKEGISIDKARSEMIELASKKDIASKITSNIRIGDLDERQTRSQAIEGALLHRFDPNIFKLPDAGRDWRGYSLLEMARTLLQEEGIRVRGLSRDEIATRALHSSSDFPKILASVANKTLRKAYETSPKTFMPFCRQVSASDFKAVHRVQLGEAPALEKVNESGEYKRGTLGEASESYRIETFGKVIGITRQVLINDDLDAFTRVPQMFGVAAANLESDVVWGIFTSNPKMADDKNLFHTGHQNLAGTGTMLSANAIGLARTAMAKQTGLDGKTIINIRPQYLIVPSSLEFEAEKLMSLSLMPTKTADIVPHSIRTLSVIAEPRLDVASVTAWYLSASPTQIDTIEYAYLEGNTGVYIETREGFDIDGVEIKARLDFGAKAIDWRGLYKNAGSAT